MIYDIMFVVLLAVCEKLPSLENGQVIYIPGSYSLTNGTLAVYLCDEGFALNGSPIRMCVVGDSVTKGTWTSTSPLCLSEFIIQCIIQVCSRLCTCVFVRMLR